MPPLSYLVSWHPGDDLIVDVGFRPEELTEIPMPWVGPLQPHFFASRSIVSYHNGSRHCTTMDCCPFHTWDMSQPDGTDIPVVTFPKPNIRLYVEQTEIGGPPT